MRPSGNNQNINSANLGMLILFNLVQVVFNNIQVNSQWTDPKFLFSTNLNQTKQKQSNILYFVNRKTFFF